MFYGSLNPLLLNPYVKKKSFWHQKLNSGHKYEDLEYDVHEFNSTTVQGFPSLKIRI